VSCIRFDRLSPNLNALLGGWLCPFIDLRTRLTIHDSQWFALYTQHGATVIVLMLYCSYKVNLLKSRSRVFMTG
jgi:hypothetical protein